MTDYIIILIYHLYYFEFWIDTKQKICEQYLHLCETRDELYQALEHGHVADGDQLLPDVEDDLQQRRRVLVLAELDVRHGLVLLVTEQSKMFIALLIAITILQKHNHFLWNILMFHNDWNLYVMI